MCSSGLDTKSPTQDRVALQIISPLLLKTAFIVTLEPVTLATVSTITIKSATEIATQCTYIIGEHERVMRVRDF
jgi:hypothetical protein